MTSELRPLASTLGGGSNQNSLKPPGLPGCGGRSAKRRASCFSRGYFARQENRLISRGAWTLQWRGGVVVPDAFEVGMARPPCAEPSES